MRGSRTLTLNEIHEFLVDFVAHVDVFVRMALETLIGSFPE